jgi:DinB family protein
VDRQAVHDEIDRARASFHELLDHASDADLRRSTNGTRWNNKQLLFHMLLGYLIIRALRGLVVTFDKLPSSADRRFAYVLNAVTAPFDAVNYVGAWLAGTVLPRRALGALFDRVVGSLHRRLDVETEDDLARSMRFPTRWDPFFRETMTLADVYHFPTQHFDFHRDQLTLAQ